MSKTTTKEPQHQCSTWARCRRHMLRIRGEHVEYWEFWVFGWKFESKHLSGYQSAKRTGIFLTCIFPWLCEFSLALTHFEVNFVQIQASLFLQDIPEKSESLAVGEDHNNTPPADRQKMYFEVPGLCLPLSKTKQGHDFWYTCRGVHNHKLIHCQQLQWILHTHKHNWHRTVLYCWQLTRSIATMMQSLIPEVGGENLLKAAYNIMKILYQLKATRQAQNKQETGESHMNEAKATWTPTYPWRRFHLGPWAVSNHLKVGISNVGLIVEQGKTNKSQSQKSQRFAHRALPGLNNTNNRPLANESQNGENTATTRGVRES